MWELQKTTIEKEQIYQYRLLENNQPLSFRTVIDNWIENEDFRTFYTNLLINAPFCNFFWEHPPLTTSNLDQAYEFVLIKSDRLGKVNPSPNTFKAYYDSDQSVVCFPNLGRNAMMVVPVPVSSKDYAHLGRFIRNADDTQVHVFWKTLGAAFLNELTTTPRWLSTHGLGVYWLHIRIDQIPKYYHYQPYRRG